MVLVAHPDDVEYGLTAAVDRWTGEGRTVAYVLASSGEAGIEGTAPEQAVRTPRTGPTTSSSAALPRKRCRKQDPHLRTDIRGDLLVDVDDHLDAAIASPAEHRVHLEMLGPDTPVIDQARRQIESACGGQDLFNGRPGLALRVARATTE